MNKEEMGDWYTMLFIVAVPTVIIYYNFGFWVGTIINIFWMSVIGSIM